MPFFEGITKDVNGSDISKSLDQIFQKVFRNSYSYFLPDSPSKYMAKLISQTYRQLEKFSCLFCLFSREKISTKPVLSVSQYQNAASHLSFKEMESGLFSK